MNYGCALGRRTDRQLSGVTVFLSPQSQTCPCGRSFNPATSPTSRRSSRSSTTTWRWTKWIHWASRPHRAARRQVNTGKPRDPSCQWCWTRLLLLAWKTEKDQQHVSDLNNIDLSTACLSSVCLTCFSIVSFLCVSPLSPVSLRFLSHLCVSPVCFLWVSSAVLHFVSRLSGAFSRWRSWRLGLKADCEVQPDVPRHKRSAPSVSDHSSALQYPWCSRQLSSNWWLRRFWTLAFEFIYLD